MAKRNMKLAKVEPIVVHISVIFMGIIIVLCVTVCEFLASLGVEENETVCVCVLLWVMEMRKRKKVESSHLFWMCVFNEWMHQKV